MARPTNRVIMGGIIELDTPEPVTFYADGVITVCGIYRSWYDMHRRVNDKKFHIKNPTYVEVTVCKEWHKFSGFREWAECHFHAGLQLDKDIILVGSKLYSPETCAYVPQRINKLFIKSAQNRGKYPSGVCYKSKRKTKKFSGQGSGDGCREHLGYFITEEEAHQAWQRYKIRRMREALDWYEKEPYFDLRVGESIIRRMGKIEDDIQNKKETLWF